MGRFRSWKRTRVYSPELLLQQLEERIVLDAAVNPAPQDNPTDHPASGIDHLNPTDAAAKTMGLDTGAAGGAGGGGAGLVAQLPDSFNHVFGENLNVVLISNNLADIKTISDAAASDAKVIVYDASHDNLGSIEAKLHDLVDATGQKIDHLAIVSHGDPGLLKLTSTDVYTTALVESNIGPWQTLGTLLSKDARIDFYGCDIGQGMVGSLFVNSVANATGHTVWASDNITGSIAGADWQLEVHSGLSTMPYLIDGSMLAGTDTWLDTSPIAVNQNVSVNEDGTLTITVTGLDADDPDVSTVSFQVTSTVTHGTLSSLGPVSQDSPGHYSQQFIYDPAPNYAGGDSFQFKFVTPAANWIGFASPTDIGTDTDETRSIQVGDVDHDGDLDVIAGNHRQPNKVYLNNGLGTLTDFGSFGDGTDYTESIKLGDVDRDGDLDVVAGNALHSKKVFLNNGSGSFSFHSVVGTDTDYTRSIDLGDVDNDGDLDLVAGNYGQNKVYLNDGAGTFSYFGTIGADSDPTRAIQLGDVDRDGDLDVVAGNYQSTKVYSNDGHGVFVYSGSIGSSSEDTWSVQLGDVDKDGDLDAVSGNWNQTNKVYLNDGSGSFAYSGTLGIHTDATDIIQLCDVDRDGDLDAVVGNAGQNRAYINDGTGRFADSVNIGTGGFSSRIVLGDMNKDGLPDVVLGNDGQVNQVSLNRGFDYTGPFQMSSGLAVGTETGTAWAVAGADLNGDGHQDLISGNYNRFSQVFLGDGTGDFTHAVGTNIGLSASAWVRSIAVADLNSDGKLDIVLGDLGGPTKVFLGDGTGDFSHVAGTDIGPTPETRAVSVVAADFNKDGKLDIVTGIQGGTGISKLYLGNGSGDFSSVTGTRIGGAATPNLNAMAAGDVDNDGDLDIVSAIWNDTKKLYRNNGTGDFSSVSAVSIGSDVETTASIQLADVNKDGWLDVVAGNDGTQRERLYLNNGSGGYTAGSGAYIGSDGGFTHHLLTSDMNLDGWLDVVAINGGDNNRLYLNSTGGGYTTGSGTALPDTDDGLGGTICDLNSDGRPDLITANHVLNKIHLNVAPVQMSSAGTVTITVSGVNDAPSAKDFSVEVNEDAVKIVNGWKSVDPDGEPAPASVSIGELPIHGTLFLDSNGNNRPDTGEEISPGQVISWNDAKTSPKVKYLGSDDYFGNDSFTYMAIDSTGAESPVPDGQGRVDITVNPLNDAPTVEGQSLSVAADGTFILTVVGHDADRPDASSVSFKIANMADHGKLVLLGSVIHDDNGTYTQQFAYTPDTSFVGPDEFTVQMITPGGGPWLGFSNGANVGTSAQPTNSIQFGDMDRDGDLDIVVGNWGSTVKIYLNNSGDFSTVVSVGAALNAKSVQLGDMDRDGDLDIVVGTQGVNKLLLNQGTDDAGKPVFSTALDIGTQSDDTWSIDVGDVDNDGDLDVVAGNYNSTNKLYINQGLNALAQPIFSAGADLPGGSHRTSRIEIADVDGDGDLDIAVGNYQWLGDPSKLNKIYHNSGSGVFLTESGFPGGDTLAMTFGDFDNDGDLDYINGDIYHSKVAINTGGGSLSWFQDIGGPISSAAVGDLNQDGNQDYVCGTANELPFWSAPPVEGNYYILGNGDCTFGTSGYIGADKDDTHSVQLGDVDLDGDLDMIAGNYNQTSKLYLNLGQGALSSAPAVFNVTVLPVHQESPVAVDQTVTVDEDGSIVITVTGSDADKPDATDVQFDLTHFPSHGTLTAVNLGVDLGEGQYSQQFLYTPDSDYFGPDNFGFTLTTSTSGTWKGFALPASVGTDTDSTQSTDIGDVNNDGFMDVVAGNYGQQKKVYLNDGVGGLTYAGVIGTETDSTRAIRLGDIDNDGDLDAVVANTGQSNKIYTNNGHGIFTLDASIGAAANSWAAQFGDLDNDGDLDLVIGNASQTDKVYLNDGKGSFTYSSDLGTDTESTRAVELADLDNDGDLDAVVAAGGGLTRIFENNGSAAFTYRGSLSSVTAWATSLAVGDVNGDGNCDIVQGNWNATNTVYLNDGHLGFSFGGNITSHTDATNAIKLGDLDRDGDLDVIAGNWGPPNKIYLNDGTGQFSYFGSPAADLYNTNAVQLGDVNKDGYLDIVAGNWNQVGRLYINLGCDLVPESSAAGAITISVNPVNDAPTDITLSNAAIAENADANAVVGVLGAVDPDNPDVHTFTLAAGVADNDLFDVVNGNLVAKSSFDFEGQNSYTVHVTGTDAGGLSAAKDFIIGLTNVNEVPTDITLSNSTVAENQSSETVVGTLAASDPDTGQTFTYSLVSNPDGAFKVVGNELRTAKSLDHEGTPTIDVTMRVTDSGDPALSYDKAFDIAVDNVNEAPVNIVPIAVQQTDASGEVIFDAAHNNLISVSDVDTGTGQLKVILTATHGTMTLNGVAGLTFDPGQDGTADATMTFTGTLEAINNALNGMSFNHDAGYYGLADVAIAVNDQGNTGSGGPLTASGVVDISVEPYDTWFAGFGTETGWDVYNHAATWDEYFTHDMTLFWWHVASGDTWNFWNGTAWVSTDTLGNAPYDGGFGPPNVWFGATTGPYTTYDVFIHTAGQATYFSLDYTAAGANFWQLTNAGAWSYWDGSAWYATAGFNVEPVDVWFHGYDGADAGWDVYNHSATGDEYFTHNQTVFWWHVASGNTWQYWNGTAWNTVGGLGLTA